LPELSVIIVNYNVVHFLEQCLISVTEACCNINSEIIVVDNNSSDDSCAMIEEKFPQVKLIANKENYGFSKANNQGVSSAKGTYILILNPDTLLAEDTISQVLHFIKKQKDSGAVGIRFIDGTGKFLPESKRNVPTIKIAGQKMRGNSEHYYANHVLEKEIAEVDVLTGAFMMIKRDTYLNVGGFDEDYFMFGEDIDLSYKLLNAGYQNFYYGEVAMIHYKGESTVKDEFYLRNFYGAMQIFLRKHFNTGWVSEKFAQLAVKGLVLAKTVKTDQLLKRKGSFKNLLYLGDNPITFQKIKKTAVRSQVKMISVLPDDLVLYDCVIFDHEFLSAKKIISQINNLKEVNIAKRIIPKGTGFYIGSDSSSNRGEVVII
jgi:GT2 family glycosyltransferase